jgi:hypothetical protein
VLSDRRGWRIRPEPVKRQITSNVAVRHRDFARFRPAREESCPMPIETPLLDQVKYPADLRKLERAQLRQVADELRAEVIDAVSTTGGHLGSGLGVVELTVAIHYVFNTPADRLVWDVGHQCYPHKVITGRRDRIRTLRQGGGLSGFTKRSESEYDPFGAAQGQSRHRGHWRRLDVRRHGL